MADTDKKRYGKLEIIAVSERKGYVTCRCDCGTVKEIRLSSLTKKNAPTRSCGCIQRKIATKTGRRTVRKNAERQIKTNLQYNTNFQVIENTQPQKNNTSGHKGISWSKDKQKWEAYINVHGKRINLGRYQQLEDAVKARKAAEEKYFEPLIMEKNAAQTAEQDGISA